RDYVDAEGEVVESFEPTTIRTINIDNIPESEPLTLLLVEDMIMKGENSLACICEQSSSFYNPLRCNPANYINTVDIYEDEFLYTTRNYTVAVPDGYTFSDNFCSPLRFNLNYRPPFVSTENIDIVQQGM